MNYLSLTLFVLIGLLVLTVAIVMIGAIFNSFNASMRFRDTLKQRIKYLRLDKMLKKHGFTRDEYLNRELTTNVEKHIRACESCGATKQCDHTLKQGTAADVSFCPSHDDLKAIARQDHPPVNHPPDPSPK